MTLNELLTTLFFYASYWVTIFCLIYLHCRLEREH